MASYYHLDSFCIWNGLRSSEAIRRIDRCRVRRRSQARAFESNAGPIGSFQYLAVRGSTLEPAKRDAAALAIERLRGRTGFTWAGVLRPIPRYGSES